MGVGLYMKVVIPVINFIGLELVYFFYPYLIYPLSIFVVATTVAYIIKEIRKEHAQVAAIMISAVLFLTAHYLLIIFLEGIILVQGFIFLTSFGLYIFLYSVHDKYASHKVEHGGSVTYSLENIIGYFNLAIFFFISVDLFYLHLNSNQKFFLFLRFFIVGVIALTFSAFDIFSLRSRLAYFYIAILVFVMIEVFWVVSLLPISVYSQGALVTLVYYVMLGVSRHYLIFGIKEFTGKIIRRYLVISITGIILVLFTAKW